MLMKKIIKKIKNNSDAENEVTLGTQDKINKSKHKKKNTKFIN